MSTQHLPTVASEKTADAFLEARNAMESDNAIDAQMVLERLLRAAIKAADYELQIRTMLALISVSGHVFSFDEARKHRLRLSTKMLSLARKRKDIVAMVRAKCEFAIIQPNLMASQLLAEIAALARNDDTGAASAYLAIYAAKVAALGGRKSEANLLCSCALAMKDKISPIEIPVLLEVLATTFDDYRECARLYEQSIELRRELGQKSSFVTAVLFYLRFISGVAAYTKGRMLLREAYKIAREIGSARLITHCEKSERYLDVAMRQLAGKPVASGSSTTFQKKGTLSRTKMKIGEAPRGGSKKELD